MSLLDGIGSVVQGLAGTFGNLAGGVLNNYYNKKAQSAQNAVQWQFWNANNDYNSPVSVMQRLEEAGLNPNLVYGNGGASYQATMPTAARRAPSDISLGLNPLTFQQMENMEAQNALTKQQTSNAKTQGKILKNQNRVAKKDAEIYENTGLRPGDSVTKTIWRNLVDWFSNSKAHDAYDETMREYGKRRAEIENEIKNKYRYKNGERNPNAI